MNIVSPTHNKRTIHEISSLNGCSQTHISARMEMKNMEFLVSSPHERLSMITNRSAIPSLSVPDFFHQYTEEDNESYDTEVTKAVRSLDLAELKALYKKGRSFQCGNRFGESLLHMACRRGSVEVVQFFLECNVSINCVDDMGRTPLHDAMWNSVAQVELVDLIVSISPNLLFMSDIRGHTPLEYCRREHWFTWNKFLEARKENICQASDPHRM
jgi:ankyrin repeat protein